MEFSRPEYWSGQPFPSPGDLPNPGIEPRSPAMQAHSLPAEPQGKPKGTGVGSLSLLQRTFPTQELNRGLLHCRQILYHLSYEGSSPYHNSGSQARWHFGDPWRGSPNPAHAQAPPKSFWFNQSGWVWESGTFKAAGAFSFFSGLGSLAL